MTETQVFGEVIPVLLTVFLLVGFLIPMWVIFKRLGCNPGLALLLFVPGINFVVLYYVAYSKKQYPAGIGRA